MSIGNSESRERRGIRTTHNIISIIFLSLVALMALSFSIVLIIKNANLQREEDAVKRELDALNSEGYYTAKEAKKLAEDAAHDAEEKTRNSIRNNIKERLESGDGTTSAIRSLFPDQIVVASAGRYYFFPISDEIEHHGFSDDDFELDEDGFIKYVGSNPDIKIKNGIDVSRFQKDINWEKVAGAGIDFAIIRAGIRGTTEGKLVEDDCFTANMKGAIANGIDVGVYFYSQAVNEKEAQEEVQMLLDMIEPYDVKYPVVIDVESAESDNARTAKLSTDEYEAVVKTFCDMVDKAGYKPMVYGNVKSFTLLMNTDFVQQYNTWIAYYGVPLYYPYHFDMWQYSSSGKVPGIEGKVDLNICITDY